ncbi:MAG: extensin family protein [Deltaproteobacteria bacterium]|nr:extensin family protein [Deltaproteobacteria bacterium]
MKFFPPTLVLLLLFGCAVGYGGESPRLESPRSSARGETTVSIDSEQSHVLEDALSDNPVPDDGDDGDVKETASALQVDEIRPDANGLQDLIRSLQHPMSKGETAETATPTFEEAPFSTRISTSFSDVTVPSANKIWQMSDPQCMRVLKDAGIRTHTPSFPTPFVRTPLLLDSPVEGVVIDSKWPQKSKRRVMDCRLIVSLIQLARRARAEGVVKIEYYSTWRPITTADNCKKGRKGSNCRKVFEQAKKGQLPSQHSRATAIDIRWFTFESGAVVDVLEHYEKHFHAPPCDDRPDTWEGRFLQHLACALHRDRVFNVMLTPNADRDHVNHFHFDITPNVKWYIIR